MLFNRILSTLLLTAVDAKSLDGKMKMDTIKMGEIGGAKKVGLKMEKPKLQPENMLYKEPDCYGGVAPGTHFVKLPSYLWNYSLYGGCRTSQVNIQQGSLSCNFQSQMDVELNPRHPKPEDTPYSIRPKLTLFPEDKAFYECVNKYECTKCEYQLVCDDCGWMDIVDMRNCKPWYGLGCHENDIKKRKML